MWAHALSVVASKSAPSGCVNSYMMLNVDFFLLERPACSLRGGGQLAAAVFSASMILFTSVLCTIFTLVAATATCMAATTSALRWPVGRGGSVLFGHRRIITLYTLCMF